MKWGIASLYYKSSNIGGILQAYAMTKLINSIDGQESEEICYDLGTSKKMVRQKRFIIERLKKITLKKVINRLRLYIDKRIASNNTPDEIQKLKKQRDLFVEFREMIPHS